MLNISGLLKDRVINILHLPFKNKIFATISKKFGNKTCINI
jgi:hypothetical protein